MMIIGLLEQELNWMFSILLTVCVLGFCLFLSNIALLLAPMQLKQSARAN